MTLHPFPTVRQQPGDGWRQGYSAEKSHLSTLMYYNYLSKVDGRASGQREISGGVESYEL